MCLSYNDAVSVYEMSTYTVFVMSIPVVSADSADVPLHFFVPNSKSDRAVPVSITWCTCIEYLFIFSSHPKTFNLLIKAERNCYIRSSSSVYICLYTKANTLKGLETIC